MRFAVDFEDEAVPLPAGTRTELLPTGDGAVSVFSDGRKVRGPNAATVKWAAPKGETEKRLVVDGADGGNLSGLKFSYAPKTGLFKGSFKVYVLETTGEKTKLRKLAAKVNGFVLSGIGYGTAEVKKAGVYPAGVLSESEEVGAE